MEEYTILLPDVELTLVEYQMLADVLGHPMVKKYIKSLQTPVARDILTAQKSPDETHEAFYLRVEKAKGVIEGLEYVLRIEGAPAPQQPQPQQ